MDATKLGRSRLIEVTRSKDPEETMDRIDRELARVMLERWIEGTLLTDLLDEADELAADADADPTEWEELMENLHSEETPDDLQRIAVRIDAQVLQHLKPGS